jgi:hypothetical protein
MENNPDVKNCPSCKRSYLDHTKFWGMPAFFWKFIMVIIVIILIFSFFIYLETPKQRELTLTDRYELHVIEGSWAAEDLDINMFVDEVEAYEIIINIESLDDSRFDVYIMEDEQYYAAYGWVGWPDELNKTLTSFSSEYSWENVTQVEEIIQIPGGYFDTHYIVVDNMDINILPDDAVPVGNLTVNFEVISKCVYLDW